MKKIILILLTTTIFLTGCGGDSAAPATELLVEDDVTAQNDTTELESDEVSYFEINSVDETAFDEIDVNNSGVEEDQRLYKLNLTIQNPTDETFVYNFVNFDGILDDDSIITTNSLYYSEDEAPILSNEIAPGESETGYIYFSVDNKRTLSKVVLKNEKLETIDSKEVTLI